MKRAQIIGIAVAGVAGVLAFVMVKGIVSRPQLEKKVEVKVNSTATKGSSTTRLVTITSVGDGSKQDAVSFTGRRL